MTVQPTRILYAAEQQMRFTNLRETLRLSGFDREPEMLHPRAAFAALRPGEASLILIDAKRPPDPVRLAQAVRSSPQSRFVLTGNAITPQMLRVAIETGIHGVLATGLPVEESAQALALIWRGERQFRFDCAPARTTAPAPSACDDFDSAWMFGQYV